MPLGTVTSWMAQSGSGLITGDNGDLLYTLSGDLRTPSPSLVPGERVSFVRVIGPRGPKAVCVESVARENGAGAAVIPSMAENVQAAAEQQSTPPPPLGDGVYSHYPPPYLDTPVVSEMESEEIEDLDTDNVDQALLSELSRWRREARAEDNDRYFWHSRDVDQIGRGEKYFVIGRKGSGKTAICEYFNRMVHPEVFTETLSFKNFPFNELYGQKDSKYTTPNQFITLWKYLIYNTVCRMMLKNQSVDEGIRAELETLYKDSTSLPRRVGQWIGREFGLSLFGLSIKIEKKAAEPTSRGWIDQVDFLEDLIARHAGAATYYVLFDSLDEDYRDIINMAQYEQYTALITSLFKAVQDVRTAFLGADAVKVFPIIFLRDDIYELVKDPDKNKWGDSRIDLSWDYAKIQKVMAFRISRALAPNCKEILPFEVAWAKVFGTRRIRVGRGKRLISTYEFICRSTLLRPRDFVAYLQTCAQYASEEGIKISPDVIKRVDKGFSNYLKDELLDELFTILPDIAVIFDAISQLRKWNFTIGELERAYDDKVKKGLIQQKRFDSVVQSLYHFSIIGNAASPERFIFRYQNRDARLNYNERIVVHRGLFKALQII